MEYTLIRSKRKTLSLEIKADGEVVVRAPLRASTLQINRFINSREDWIVAAIERQKKRAERLGTVEKYTPEELRGITKKARGMLEPLVEDYAEILGVRYGRIAVRKQKSRWGSCTREGNLNFNCLLAEAPEPVMRYVVVHELCHRKQMNHSKAFWWEVEQLMPDYKVYRKWLKDNGSALIARLP